MKTALIQLQPELGQVRANVEHALTLMQGIEADLFVLPELFTSGYTFAERAELEACAEPAAGGPSFKVLTNFARQRAAYVAYGFAESAPGGEFFNSANLIGPDGLVGTYRKMHLFSLEKVFFSLGDAPAPVFDLPIGRIGMMICFDWRFPEVSRSLMLRGAQLIVHPSNLVLPHCPAAMITRALENGVFTATCDRVGIETNGVTNRFIGSSQIVSPQGEVIVRLSADREEVAVADLNLASADCKRITETNDALLDRRPELYAF